MTSPFLKIRKFCGFSCRVNRALKQNQKVAYWDFQNHSNHGVETLKKCPIFKH